MFVIRVFVIAWARQLRLGILCAALGLHIAQQPAAAVRCPNPIKDLNSFQGTVLDSMLPASISTQAAFVKLLVKLQLD